MKTHLNKAEFLQYWLITNNYGGIFSQQNKWAYTCRFVKCLTNSACFLKYILIAYAGKIVMKVC